jgi:hypothetical protein
MDYIPQFTTHTTFREAKGRHMYGAVVVPGKRSAPLCFYCKSEIKIKKYIYGRTSS